MNKVLEVTQENLNKELPTFRAGDTLSIGVKVIEGEKTRIQLFEGVVIAISSGAGTSKTFTIRKISNGIGVERTFQTHSPIIGSIIVKRKGAVRQAKLFYLRDRTGRSARIKEKLN